MNGERIYALTNCTILDGTKDMKPITGCAMVVENDTIKAILPEDQLTNTFPGITAYDLEGGYLMPGLINLHLHMVITGKVPKSDKATDYKKLVQTVKKIGLVKKYFLSSEAANVKNQLLSGVTTIRSVGGIDDWDGIVRDRVNAGKILGPRILSANTAVSVPGGHFAGALATESATPDQAMADVETIAKTNPDLIKIMITGGVMDASEEGEPGALRMSPEIVKACCDKAHELGYKVAAHVESPEGVRVALEGGVDTIEHGAKPDDEILELFKKTGSVDICTISPALPYAKLPLEISKCGEVGQKNGSIVMQGIIDCAKDCLNAGVTVGLGTDTGCPFITHYDMWRELDYFVHYCGVTPAFALHTATLVNAGILGLQDQIGSLEAGKQADFIVSASNPLESPKALRTLKMVARAGEIIRDPQPKRDPAVDAALDSLEL